MFLSPVFVSISVHPLKGRHFSGVVAEKWIGKNSSKVGEDLKVLLSQLSGTRGLEQSPSALYEELEEERNASTIASDQTMAMITRLQEKKAVLHMEALQQLRADLNHLTTKPSLRMMEEQGEYDNEPLRKIDNLLVEKKEIQDLEAEAEGTPCILRVS
ncbi:hypothetical protein ACFX2I_020013 [Malus domestica]